MSLHVVTLTSLWLFTSICVSGMWIYFKKRDSESETLYSRCIALHTDPAYGFLGKEGKCIWGRGGSGDPPTVFSLLGTVGMLSHLKLHVGLHHRFSSYVRIPSPTNADNEYGERRVEHC